MKIVDSSVPEYKFQSSISSFEYETRRPTELLTLYKERIM
jgi:hypothetical protein